MELMMIVSVLKSCVFFNISALLFAASFSLIIIVYCCKLIKKQYFQTFKFRNYAIKI